VYSLKEHRRVIETPFPKPIPPVNFPPPWKEAVIYTQTGQFSRGFCAKKHRDIQGFTLKPG
jgi:hypothetical protein